jgi:uncharacterized Fe-S center protein
VVFYCNGKEVCINVCSREEVSQMEWKLEVEEFNFSGCMHNHTTGVDPGTSHNEETQ